MAQATLATVIAALDRRFPPSLAEAWDRVGLVCGNQDDSVRCIWFAVDPTLDVAQEALSQRADLLVAHHPLLLRGVHSVATTTGKGRVLHLLIAGGCALFTAHTNADAAEGGTNATLAAMLHLTDVVTLAASGPPVDKMVVFVPTEHRQQVLGAVFAAGAGHIGDYDSCAYSTPGTGQFRPLAASDPFIGQHGEVASVAEERIEVVLPRSRRAAVAAAVRAAHPYQEPAFDIWETVTPDRAGIGRIGSLPEPLTVRELAEAVDRILPPTATGVRIAGDPHRQVRRVAICSGAGDSLLPAARASGAEAYLTADLRHHPVDEHLAEGGCPLIEMSHWASEWPWLAGAARDITADLAALGFTVEARVSSRSTDPWSLRIGGLR